MVESNINEILETSFLPTLSRDLDDFLVNEELFADYRQQLLLNTQILFDAIQQYKNTENVIDSKVSLKKNIIHFLNLSFYFLDEIYFNSFILRKTVQL